jgi:hypothetical protein
MVAVSIGSQQHVSHSRSASTAGGGSSYLGMVTPAFSQAWIRADPAASRSANTDTHTHQSIGHGRLSPSIETFFPSSSSQHRTQQANWQAGSRQEEGAPIVSSTSAGL